MNPAAAHRRVAELRHQLPNRHLLAPRRLAGPLLDVLDEAGEHPDLEVGGAARQENIVGVPVKRSHSGLQWLFDVLSDPPVHASLVVADGDDLGTGADGKFVLLRRPANAGGGSVNPEKYKSVLPSTVILFHPNVGVPIRRAGHYPVRLGSPIYASDSEIMLVQFPIFFEAFSIGRIQLHLIEWLTVTFLPKTKNLFGVSRESKLFPVPRPC